MPRTATARTNCAVLGGSKLQHRVFRRTGVIPISSTCDLREQFIRSSSVYHQHALRIYAQQARNVVISGCLVALRSWSPTLLVAAAAP